MRSGSARSLASSAAASACRSARSPAGRLVYSVPAIRGCASVSPGPSASRPAARSASAARAAARRARRRRRRRPRRAGSRLSARLDRQRQPVRGRRQRPAQRRRGNDNLFGGPDDDTGLFGGGNDDVLNGDSGSDTPCEAADAVDKDGVPDNDATRSTASGQPVCGSRRTRGRLARPAQTDPHNQQHTAPQKLASHCLLERDDCTSGPTAASTRAAAPRRDGYDLRDVRSHVTWTECHGTATAPDRPNYRSPEGCGGGGTGAAPGGAPQGRASRWPRTTAVSPRPSATSDAPVTANASRTPASNCSAPTAGSAGSAPAPATASARYSVSNLCLILLANPNASFVAGFKAWLELGYCVRKGEHAIWIFAPMPTRRRGAALA